jgi:hypothetical protein
MLIELRYDYNTGTWHTAPCTADHAGVCVEYLNHWDRWIVVVSY